VSLQLHKLAGEQETELFIRSGKRLFATPAAFRLADRARVVQQLMSQIQQEFANDPQKDTKPSLFSAEVGFGSAPRGSLDRAARVNAVFDEIPLRKTQL
jgi:DNA-binding transcriptional LysR family regulator